MAKQYTVNEVFFSLQGEGKRAGTANVFVRFTGCNLQCVQEAGDKSPGGFDCDTEFTSGRRVTAEELMNWIDVVLDTHYDCPPGEGRKKFKPAWIVFTGGEPGLQLDSELCEFFHKLDFKLAIETNGSVALPTKAGYDVSALSATWDLPRLLSAYELDWITVSPKVAEHAIRQLFAHEVKYVRGYGQAIPRTSVNAIYNLISPAFNGLNVDRKTVEWCQRLILDNPKWELSVQHHKYWNVR